MKIFMTLLLMFNFFIAYEVLAGVDYPYPEDTSAYLRKDPKDSYLRGRLRISNPGSLVWLVQVWTEDTKRNRYANVYPSLMRLEPNSSKMVNIYHDRKLDASELKWLLISFIPSQDEVERNQLTMPVTYRLKINKGS